MRHSIFVQGRTEVAPTPHKITERKKHSFSNFLSVLFPAFWLIILSLIVIMITITLG